jgi:succinate dehydrogenase/fumarate reductase flavoprotein subunit
MGLLRTLAVILLAYYVLRTLSRLFAPRLINYAARKAEARVREMYGMQEPQAASDDQRFGNITVERKTTNKNKGSEKVGEYIEFEEID